MSNPDDRQDGRDREREEGAQDLEAALGEILGEPGSEETTADSAKNGEKSQDLLGQDEIASLLGEDAAAPAADAAGSGDGELSQEEMDGMLGDVYGGGQRLARVGDCVLMASEDRMRAWFRGPMPGGTTVEDVTRLLAEAGVCFGIVPGRIHDVLPRKRPSRRTERRRKAPEPERSEVIVAEGLLPVPPEASHIAYRFCQPDEEEVRQVRALLEGYDYEAVKKCTTPLTFVLPGQVLAQIVLGEGKSGRDVFGQETPAPLPAGIAMKAGENAALSADGQSGTATGYGYAVADGDEIAVLSPVWISRDLMRAFLVQLRQEGSFPELRPDDIGKMLEDSGIVHGILEEEIQRLCHSLRGGKPGERATQIARGTETQPGEDAAWRFLCDPDLTRYFGEIQRILSRSQDVQRLAEDAHGLAGKAVSAGERLAVKRPPSPGKMGRDVFGEEFLPDEPEDAVLDGSENIRFAEDGASCFAEIFGYLGIGKQGNRVEIIPPVWVAPDRMAAYFVNLPQLGEHRAPTPEEIDPLLQGAGVRFGIDQQAIGLLCEKLKQKLPVKLAISLARGQEPQPGEDGGFDFAVDRERKLGFFRKDGSVDFKQLNLAPLLDAGQEIGHRLEATRGSSGTDVSGRELPTKDGREVLVDVGQNVRLMRSPGEPDRYQSEVEGELVIIEHLEQAQPMVHIAVHLVKTVDGDVDFHTGNIDFPGSVHVEGSVMSGFSVTAEGNVVVGDSVEEGAVVEAGGNVAVKNGIIGEKTRVTAKGDLFAKFINAARVRARGDINIAEYIFNGRTQADGDIVVLGATGSRVSGVIAGGTGMAGVKIEAQAVGTEASPPTRLVAGVDAALFKQATDWQQLIDRYNGTINKALRALQVEGMAPAQVRQVLLNLVLKARGERKKVMARAARNLLELQARLAKAAAQKKKVDERLEQIAARASIQVTKQIAARTVVEIGGHTQAVGEEGAVRFALGEDDNGEIRLQMTAD